MTAPIAKRELTGVRANGERFPITITIDAPYSLNDTNGNWRCSVSVTPLCHHPFEIGGFDSMQALSLAVYFAHTQLADFVQRGGRLLFPGTDDDFLLEESAASLGPRL